MILTSLDKYRDIGLLILRIGIGISFMMHGFPKITGGKETWTMLGGSMANVGITFMPEFWGFMAAFSEFFGGLFLLLGLFFRPATILLTITMLIACIMHIKKGDDFNGWSHAFESGVLFFSLFFIGPGTYSIDEKFKKKDISE